MKALSSAQAAHTLALNGQAAEVIEAARRRLLACPRCQGVRLSRHGNANGLQRFRCQSCGRTFNSLTGTPLASLRLRYKWLDYCDTRR